MRRIVLTLAFCLLLLFAPAASAATVDAPDAGEDLVDESGICIWGFADDCIVPAYECFRPDRPLFGIGCK